ncbi:S8 family serine peptidase [Paenibacillus sp. IITD108]|uniref:S8 family serine peptidase n=1 Tax=Paenibacillus sp. IITD108 TaxID=3116649 RepID=UPI002F40061A
MRSIYSVFIKYCLIVVLLCTFAQDYSITYAAGAEGQKTNPIPRQKSEVLVKYKDQTKAKEVKERVGRKLTGQRLTDRQKLPRTGIEVIAIEGNGTVDSVLTELRKDPNVQYAQPNYELTPLALPEDERFGESWGLNNTGQTVAMQSGTAGIDIQTLEAWEQTWGQASTLVGVLDTGIDIHHPDLVARIYQNPLEIPGNGIDDDGNGYIDDVNGWDFANDDASVYDAATHDKHGTFVAGLIAASANEFGTRGVAPGVTLLPLKFMSENKGYTSDAIAAIEYAKQAGVKIINASFGSPANNIALEDAIRNSGILFIGGGGNNGQDAVNYPVYPAAYPLANVLSVAALDNQGRLAAISNYGSNVDIAAPGMAMLSTFPDDSYGYMSGTSMAAAIVTGVAALVHSVYPDLSAEQLAQRIKSTARPLSTLKGKVKTGGIVDAAGAIRGTVQDDSTTIEPFPVGEESESDDIVVALAVQIDPNLQEQIHYGEEGVSVTTGNFAKSFTDMSFATPGFTFNIGRTYNSRDDRPSSWMGRGWTFSFEGSLNLTGNQMVAKLPNGSAQVFIKSGETYTANDSRSQLVKQQDNTHVLTTSDQYSYGFTTDGYLYWMKDPLGNSIQIAVSNTGKITKITDTVGRTYTIDYIGELIVKVTDITGRFIRYNYDSSKRLISVQDASEQIIERYEYDSFGYLNKIRNAQNHVTESMVYSRDAGPSLNKVTRYTNTFGNTQYFTYDTTNRKTTITDINGRTMVKWYDTAMFVTASQDPEGKKSTVTYYTDETGFNKFGEEKAITDRNGNQTSYVRDNNGNITKTIHPDGSYREYGYDQWNHLISEKDELGKSIYYEYNNQLLTKRIQPVNGTDVYTGELSDAFAVTSYSYYSQAEAQRFGAAVSGLLKSITNPEGHVTVYTYDKHGNTDTMTDPEGGITRKSYSPLGWLTSIMTPEGYRTDYTYDKNGRLLRTIEDGGETTRLVYDAQGLVTQNIKPNQYKAADDQLNASGTAYTNVQAGARNVYNPNGTLKSKIDEGGYTYSFEYDIYGNQTKEKRPNGSEYLYQYDVMNRLIRVSFKENEAAAPVLLQSNSYVILTGGFERRTETRYLNETEQAVTNRLFDTRGREVEIQRPDGTTEAIAYLANGNISATTDARGNMTYYSYDGMNRLVDQWSPLDHGKYRYIGYHYDRNGQLLEERKGKDLVSLYSKPVKDRMITTSYVYDGSGRVTRVIQSSGSLTKQKYDLDGRLVRKEVYMSEKEAIATQYSYNHRGQVIAEKNEVRSGDVGGIAFAKNDTMALVTKTSYDANGNIVSVTTPDGNETTYSYDALNQPTSVRRSIVNEYNKPSVAVTQTVYNWAGKPLKVIDALGRTTTYTYNAAGSLEMTSYPDGGKQLQVYDRAQRRIAIISPQSYNANLRWNEMGRTEYVYDRMNRLKLTTEVFQEKVYRPDMQQWTTKWRELPTAALAYDENGNTIKTLDGEGYALGTGKTVDERIATGYGTRSTYNAANLIASTTDPSAAEKGVKAGITYTYDGLGREITETDAAGTVYVTYYDDAGRVTATAVRKTATSPEQQLSSNRYDLAGHLLSETDANGNTITYTYNTFGQVRTMHFPGDQSIPAQTITRQYDVMGRVAKEWDELGAVQLWVYDPDGRVIRQTEQNSSGTEAIMVKSGYDMLGNLRFETDANGITTEFSYDAMNRVKKKIQRVSGVNTEPAERQTLYQYDYNGNLVSETNWLNQENTYIYDGLNRLIETRDANGVITERLEYNANHAQVRSWDALNRLTQFRYDRNQREIVRIDPKNNRTENSFNALGLLEVHQDGRGNETFYTYDFLRRLTGVTNALGETTRYTYDLVGNQLTQTDGRGLTHTFTYNAANKLSLRMDPPAELNEPVAGTNHAGKTESYRYDADGNLQYKIDRNGHQTTYQYDIHGRLQTETVEGAGIVELALNQRQVTYTYDKNGNQLKMTDSTGTTSRTYDEFNRVITKTVPKLGTTIFQYDRIEGLPAGYSAEKTVDPKNNETIKVFDKTNRLVEVRSGPQDTAVYTYYEDGSLKTVEFANGIKEEYTYTANNQLSTLKNWKGTSLLDSYAYTYDAAGNQLTKTEMEGGVSRGTTTYAYDALNRLSRVNEPSGRVTSYIYDASGNRIQEKVTQGSQTTVSLYTYNEQNRLMTVTEVQTNGEKQTDQYSYDRNGNLIYKERIVTKLFDPFQPVEPSFGMFIVGQENENSQIANLVSGTQQYVYDGWNQLIAINSGSGNTTYAYNGEGLRTQKTVRGETTLYLYEYDKVVLETDGKGQTKARNLYGINLLMRQVGNEKYNYLYNGHSDVTSLIDTAGVVQASYRYDAFGVIIDSIGTVNNPIRYAGYQFDEESELYYLNARYYDPKIARFLSEDTYRGNATDPLSLNLYTYVHNEPIMYWDPTGHWEEGDQKLNKEAQAKIIALTNAYYKAQTSAEKKAIQAQAEAIRGVKENYQAVVTPLNSYSETINAVLNKAAETRGYMTASEWNSAVKSAGITVKTDPLNYPVGNTTVKSTTTTTTIGRVNLEVKSAAITMVKNTNLITGTAAINLSYNVSKNEARFVSSVAHKSVSLEQILVTYETLRINKGDISEDELKAIGIKVNKDLWLIGGGTISGVKSAYAFSEKGLTTAEAELLYQQNRRNIEMAYGAAFALNGVLRINSKRTTEPVKVVANKGGCNCFTAGTKVLTDEGEKPIEEIEVGDKVLAKDEFNPDGELAYKEVTALYRNQRDDIIKLHVGEQVIETTDNHPFWIEGKGWVFADELQVGDMLQRPDGSNLTIDKVEFVKLDEPVTVYNFTVADFHTYYVTDIGIWVHNTNCKGAGLTGGGNWKYNADKDLDLRGTGKTYKDALDEAFKRTGVPKDQFNVTKWGKDKNGKSVPVEWSGPNGANVNMDIPQWNNVKSDGTLGEGPHQPHIGYQSPGKGTNRTRGHIFVDDVPATR